jgi:alpha/beta superfamily hydrolase
MNLDMPASADKSVFPPTTTDPPNPDSQNVPATLRSFDLCGPAGRLEALLNEGQPDAPFATLICHPHPLGGGTMHNKVVYHAMKVFSGLGWPVLRFNFRGTGLSEGAHDGHAEAEDVCAGIEWLSLEYRKPLVVAGFSFGAAMGLQACCGNSESNAGIRGFAALGLPTHSPGREYTYPFLANCIFPKLFLSGDRDQFAPVDQLRSVTGSAREPKKLVLIQNADHFFSGHLPAMQTALGQWIRATFLADQKPDKDSKRLPLESAQQ